MIRYYFIWRVDLYYNLSSLSIPLAIPVLQFQSWNVRPHEGHYEFTLSGQKCAFIKLAKFPCDYVNNSSRTHWQAIVIILHVSLFRVIEILFWLLTQYQFFSVELCLAKYNTHNISTYSASHTSVVERTIVEEFLSTIYF